MDAVYVSHVPLFLGARGGSFEVGLLQMNSIRFGAFGVGAVRFGSIHFHSIRFDATFIDSIRLPWFFRDGMDGWVKNARDF